MTTLTLEFGLHDYMRKSLEVAGLSVADAAERLDVAPETVSRWINGRRSPSTPVLMAWAHVTGVDYAVFEGCARRDSNPQPSDLYLDAVDERCPYCEERAQMERLYGAKLGPCPLHDGSRDSFEVEHQLLLLVEAVRS